MAALGEAGAYMAERGLNVTAFDITPEMIAEGRKRFGNIPGLRLYEGDVRDFRFDVPPADFCFCTDFGHLLTIDDVKRALVCVNDHLRDGGCFVIETTLRMPDAESSNFSERETFHPVRQIYSGITVWKTGTGRFDAENGRSYISQTFYAEDESGHVESFDHEFYLQSYTREAWLQAFAECGFEVSGEYSSREVESWMSGSGGFQIFETVKSTAAKKWDQNYCHTKIDLETDRDYILECHCRTNYECDTPWARKLPYDEYRANWFANADQLNGFLSALLESMKDERSIAEIIKTGSGETVAYFWVPFHGEDASFIWADAQDLYVEEAFRRTGVAAYLMDYAERSAKRSGAKVIRSGTGIENIASQGLHQKRGYYQYRVEYEKVLRED
jgi:SAM-dependent methyltransferase/GNAT superfamily N-acetyltransferase